MNVREIQSGGEWNRVVRSLPGHDLYQGFEWGEVRSSQGWRPRRLAVFDGDDCVAASTVLIKPLPLTGRKAAYCPGGPLVREAGDDASWAAWLSGVRELARAEGLAFLRTDRGVPAEGDPVAPALAEHGFQPLAEDWTTWNVPRIVMRMSIVDPEDVLRRALRRRFREYIASAPRRGLTVRPAAGLDEGLHFREALAVVGQRRGQPVRSRAYFGRLWREYVRPGHGVLLVAEHEGHVVGGLLGARFGSQAHMLYVVVREAVGGLRLHQAPLLYWEFVRWARQVGCTSVDWGGIGTQYPPREDDPGFGLYHFKLGFNARLVHLTAYHDIVFAPRVYDGFRLLERRVAAPAWTTRARLNRGIEPIARLNDSARRKVRQFGVGVRQRGVMQTVYWGAFGFLRPNRFHVLAHALSDGDRPRTGPSGLSAEIWDARAVQTYRRSRSRLPPEFYQDEIDGVEMCSVVRAGDEVAGLIWIYRTEDASRLFRLRETEAELNNGFVLPEFRGRGAFKVSIVKACEWLRDQDCRVVYAMVHTDNHPSKAAFEGVGFKSIATVRHFLLHRPAYRAPSSEESRA